MTRHTNFLEGTRSDGGNASGFSWRVLDVGGATMMETTPPNDNNHRIQVVMPEADADVGPHVPRLPPDAKD